MVVISYSGMLYVFLFSYVSQWHCFRKEKLKITFCVECFDTWMIHLNIVVKTSLPFPGVWLGKLFDILRCELSITRFGKYLLKVSVILESLVSSFPFLIRVIFSQLHDLLEKNLFMVFQNFLLSIMFFTFKYE